MYVSSIFIFFFSSRRRHTRCSRDWSSDVCSSDLPPTLGVGRSLQVHLFQCFVAPLDGRLWFPMCFPFLLSIPREGSMERTKCSGVFASLAIFTMTLALGVTCKAQEQSQDRSEERRVGKECRSR